MGKKYLETKDGSLEQSVLGVWQNAIEEAEVRVDGRTKGYKTHRAKLEAARQRRESKKVNKEEVELDEWTVSDVEIAMKKKYGKIDKKAIEKLKKVQHMGNVDRNDLVKAGHGKLNIGGLAYPRPHSLSKEETELDEVSGRSKTFKEYWEIGTNEYRDHCEKVTPGEGLKEKDVDPADVDDDATDDDRAAASKNIIHQLRKSIDQKGKFAVTFDDNKKVKVDAKIAQAVNDKFMAIKKPTDKEKFQSKIANSYKDMLKVLKNDYNHEETILDRIDRKLREKKNG